VYYDIGGGNRIPRISERKARTVAELRAAGVGVRRVLMAHDNTAHSGDLFESVLTMLDPDVILDFAALPASVPSPAATAVPVTVGPRITQDIERADKVGREVRVHPISGDPGPELVRLAIDFEYDLLVLDGSVAPGEDETTPPWHDYVQDHAPCALCILSLPTIPREVVDSTPSTIVAALNVQPQKPIT
jgi:hypothetical protein